MGRTSYSWLTLGQGPLQPEMSHLLIPTLFLAKSFITTLTQQLF